MKFLAAFLMLCAATFGQNLMPLPARMETGEGRLKIEPGFGATTAGYNDPRIAAALNRLQTRIAKKTALTLDGSKPALVVHCGHAGSAVQTLGEDESYKLEITPRQARLTAPNPLGVLRGLETFMQLIERDRNGWSAPAVTIEDRPRFPWRGLHLDVSRHWMPMDVVMRNLDGMAAVKLNVFHWHLTDDQGIRIESKRYPKLQELGSDGQFYTQNQVRQVIAYARERGIRVVPEFDIPAHSTAWLAGYPELGSAPGPYEIGRHWGIFEPTLDPTRESTYTFLDGFIGEMAQLFPDEYFHIGGDEVNPKQWNANPQIQAYMRQHGLDDAHVLQAYFNKRVQAIVKKNGKHMEGWDEILNRDLPKDIVIQSWRGQKSLAEAARMGYEGLLSAPYYLDAMKTAAEHYVADPLEQESAGLSAEEQKRVLGGEVCSWAEFLTPENVDSRIWPRTAAIAERFWSPQNVKDIPSMYRRLDAVSHELELVGLRHIANYRPALERLAGPNGIEPMLVLADVVSPGRLGIRQRGHSYTQQTPLNRLADIAQPESKVVRDFSNLTDHAEMRRWLRLWRDNDARLKPVLEKNPLTQELLPLSADLSALGRAGLQALDAIEKGHAPAEGWVKDQRALIERAKKPRAELLMPLAPAIEKLIDSAAALH